MIHDASFGVVPFKEIDGVWNVFLICHHDGHWAFPKGHAEENESPLQAAQRELFEETGLTVSKWISKDLIVEQYQFHRDGQRVRKEVSYYIAEVQGNEVLQKEEIKDSLWLPLDKAEERLTFPETCSIFRRAVEILLKDV